jgi:hypothetical protein
MENGTSGSEWKEEWTVVKAEASQCVCIPVYTMMSELLELVRVICMCSATFGWTNVFVTYCVGYLTYVGFVQWFSSAIFLLAMRSVFRSRKLTC